MASGSVDGSVILWSLTTGGAEAVLQGHTGGVRCLAVYDWDRLLSGSDDCTVRVWRMRQGACLGVLHHTQSVTAAHCLNDGRIFTSSLDQKLRRASRGAAVSPSHLQ